MELMIYEYLLENAIGYEKRVKGTTLMKEFNIKNNKLLRYYIEKIRMNDQFPQIIGSDSGANGGYFICVNEMEIEITLEHLYKRAMQMLETYKKIADKSHYRKQYKKQLKNLIRR